MGMRVQKKYLIGGFAIVLILGLGVFKANLFNDLTEPPSVTQTTTPLTQDQSKVLEVVNSGKEILDPAQDDVSESTVKIENNSAIVTFRTETQEWMTKSGFATPESDAELMPLAEEELEAYVLSGDLAAYGVLSFKQIQRGATENGIQTLREGVVAGSIGSALYLARLYGGEDRGIEHDKIQSYAWYRIARHMGESGSALMGKGLGYGWENRDLILAELYFSTLLMELNEESQNTRGSNLVYIPQPILMGE